MMNEQQWEALHVFANIKQHGKGGVGKSFGKTAIVPTI